MSFSVQVNVNFKVPNVIEAQESIEDMDALREEFENVANMTKNAFSYLFT